MSIKKKNKKGKEYVGFVKTQDQAESVFRTLFTDYDCETITDGIIHWLSKLENLESLHMFMDLPRLLKKYSFLDILNSNIDLPGVSDKKTIRNVGIAACLETFICCCWQLFGEKIHQNPSCDWPSNQKIAADPDTKMILFVSKMISLSDIQRELRDSLMSIVGTQYHAAFIVKAAMMENEQGDKKERMEKFENDPELKKHMKLMIWVQLMRFFLESVYFYFGRLEQLSKNAIPENPPK